MGKILVFIGLYFVLPAAFARLVIGANWKQTLMAFAIWTIGLFGGLFAFTQRIDETLSLGVTYGMFASVIVVPVLTYFVRITFPEHRDVE